MKCMKSIIPKKIFHVSDINIVITKNSVDKYLIFIVLSTFHVAESTAGVFGQIPGIWRYSRKYNEKSWCLWANYQWRSWISSKPQSGTTAAWKCQGKVLNKCNSGVLLEVTIAITSTLCCTAAW